MRVRSSTERHVHRLAQLIGPEIANYIVYLKHEVRDNESELRANVYFTRKEVEINEPALEARLEESKAKNMGEFFPELEIKEGISDLFANRFLGQAIRISSTNIWLTLNGKIDTIDKTEAEFEAHEVSSLSAAMLKVFDIITLYDDAGTPQSWKEFSQRYIHVMATADMNTLAVKESNPNLKSKNLTDEVSSAIRLLVAGRNFSEYSRRFIDSLANRTTEPNAELDVLSDIIAYALILCLTKEKLEESINAFFTLQRTKAKALELINEMAKHETAEMVEKYTERDLFFNHIRNAARESKKQPTVAVDLAKEWGEN